MPFVVRPLAHGEISGVADVYEPSEQRRMETYTTTNIVAARLEGSATRQGSPPFEARFAALRQACRESNGAEERTRTSTRLPGLAPEASASANSATPASGVPACAGTIEFTRAGAARSSLFHRRRLYFP